MSETSQQALDERTDARGAREGERTDRRRWYGSSGTPAAMRWLSEGFARSFAAVASGLLHADVRLSLSAVSEGARGEFMQALDELTCSFTLAPEGAAEEGADGLCIEFSPAAAFAMVEGLMGASKPSPPPDRPLTIVERRVLRGMAAVAGASLAGAWPEAAAPRLRPRATAPRPAGDGEDRPAVIVTFELTVGERIGTLRLCGARDGFGRGLPAGAPPRRRAAPIEVSAAFEGVAVEAEDLDGLAAGDVVATEIPPDGEAVIRIGGIPKFAARLDVSDGRRTLTITRRLDEGGSADSV